jgi:hypothetical protein
MSTEQIKTGEILSVQALAMTKGVFNQLRMVKPEEVEYVGSCAPFIGWVQDGPAEYYVGRAHGTLVKAIRMEMWDFIVSRGGGHATIKVEAERLGIGPALMVNTELDKMRNALPQIFLK